ncbi:MAG: hypothetical protein AAFR52_04190, partial [Pseudomonadota bacterium]
QSRSAADAGQAAERDAGDPPVAVDEAHGVVRLPGGAVGVDEGDRLDGTAWEADYTMRLVDGDWRIAGVSLRRLPGISS